MTEGGSPRPRLGFVGLGWIGGLRLEAVEGSDAARVASLCDLDPERLRQTGRRFPEAALHPDAETLLGAAEDDGLDGVVLATPNALHAPQTRDALERDLAAFVQKPLGVRSAEVEEILREARRRDRLVDVDYSYRDLEGARSLRSRVRAGELGEVHLVEAVFHNGYGPDKAWCFEPAISGGGALLDLGVHLLDLVLWIFGDSEPRWLHGRTRELPDRPGIDRFTAADMVLESDLRVRLTCSWNAHAGRDCDFRLVAHGTEGSAELRNVGGSFYDFELVLRHGRTEETVARDARTWMDRGILRWVDRLRRGEGFDPSLRSSLAVARIVDDIYGRSEAHSSAVPEPSAARS